MKHVDIVFDGPPDHVAPRFVEVEDEQGKSIRLGEWLQRPDGYWVLRIERDTEVIMRLEKALARAQSLHDATCFSRCAKCKGKVETEASAAVGT